MSIIKNTTYNKIINQSEEYIEYTNELLSISTQYNTIMESVIKDNLDKYRTKLVELSEKNVQLNTKIKNKMYSISRLLQDYFSLFPDVTPDLLEKEFRKDNEHIYLIAKYHDNIIDGFKFMLNGKDTKYEIYITITEFEDFYKDELVRIGMVDNITALKDAGFLHITNKISIEELFQ